jgi:hypothetical protein
MFLYWAMLGAGSILGVLHDMSVASELLRLKLRPSLADFHRGGETAHEKVGPP